MIAIDFSGISLAAILQDKVTLDGGQLDENYIRHLIINSIRSYRAKYTGKYGQVVLCCDGKSYWRKDVMPQYKANRKKNREASNIDWDHIHKCIDNVKQELREYFPYPLIEVPRVEADDIIYCLAEWSMDNDVQEDGLWHGEPHPFLVISSDGDLIQAQRFGHVDQYSPNKRGMIKPGMSHEQFLIDHIICGDSGDGVMNVLNPDTCLVEGVRQKALRATRKEEFYAKGIDACQNDEERRNYKRNQMLVDLSMIPQQYKDQIIEEFLKQKAHAEKVGRSRIMTYLAKNKMRLLIECLTDF